MIIPLYPQFIQCREQPDALSPISETWLQDIPSDVSHDQPQADLLPIRLIFPLIPFQPDP